MNGWLVAVVSEIRPSVTAAISAIPDDSPSRPSMKLMLLIIPMIQTIVKPIAIRRRRAGSLPGPNGLLMNVDGDPGDDREHREGELAQSCQRARSWR